MIRGIYIAASGLLAESARQDVIANNLANATTTGFKRSDSIASPFQEMLLRSQGMPGTPEVGDLAMGAQVQGIEMIDSQGALRFTGNTLDIALVGGGHFTVDTPAGRRYTRDGSFQLDTAGRLVTKEGHAVLGANGSPIVLDRGEVRFAADGTVTQGGAVKGTLMITALEPGSIRQESMNLLSGTPQGAPTAEVRQNHLESSTVNVVSEMVELIRVMRSFESNQKAVQSHDEALQASITKVGAVG
ncbi:MAG: flagellar hook-basal body protein [Thermoleophilia bacterium]